MASVLFNRIFSFFNGVIVILICPPEVRLAIPIVPATTAPPDMCEDLSMTCVDQIDKHDSQPSCKSMQTALECLEKVVELCDDDDDSGGDGDPAQHQNHDDQDSHSDSWMYHDSVYRPLDFGALVQYFEESIVDFKRKCEYTAAGNHSTLLGRIKDIDGSGQSTVQSHVSVALCFACLLVSLFCSCIK